MIRPIWNTTRRRGISAVEVMLVLPILLLVLLAAIQFSETLTLEDRMAEASRQGARVAATGGDETAIRNAIQNVIGTSIYNQSTVTIGYVNTNDGVAGHVSVQVTVSVPAKNAAPNYLSIIGFDNSNDSIVGQTVMRMEIVQ